MLVNFKKVIWYAAEYLTAIAFGIVSIIIIARVFGPESLGKLSYIQAIASLLIFMVVLGLEQTLLKDTAENPTNGGLLLSSFILHMVGSFFFAFAIYAVVYFIEEGNVTQELLIIEISVVLFSFFSRGTVLKIYYQAVGKPHVIGVSAIISRTTALLYIGFGYYHDFDFVDYVLFMPIQSSISFLILAAYFYQDKDRPTSFTFSFIEIKSTFVRSFPLIAATALFPLFMQGDIVLIKYLMDNESAGLYSSAAKLVEQLLFVGHVVVLAFYPKIAGLFNRDKVGYENLVESILRILLVVGLLSATFVTITADWIMTLLYGDAFKDASILLSILVWKWIFVFPAALLSRLLIIEGHFKFELIKSLVAALVSVTLNIILIPYLGLIASAIISVFSYFIADLIIYKLLVNKSTIWIMIRQAYWLLFKSPIVLIKDIRYVLQHK